MIGPIVNGSSIIVGSIVGAFLGERIAERIRSALPMTFGAASMALGIALIIKIKLIPAVILALLLGSLIGEILSLERTIQRVSIKARGLIEAVLPARETTLTQEEFLEKFVALVVLFCASGTGIFGSMTEGMTNDSSLLMAKALLDLFTSAIFATTLGYSVAVIAIPQCAIQFCLLLGARQILPFTTPEMVADFSACGGVIMFATGFRICGIKPFPVANLLPALLFVMPISAFWSKYIVGG
ncbi:DUF554 domain-containing protein [Telmatospirillum siberiense]|uniref:DUF554 domain-containing protein n=1 Tax=Telmatospirillum siberiense TaxID=382514 RepID=A0A2N3PQJ3_9PROT|nr:DUF554 domain-containing protein [Telmatospirillum siberiense]PKU22658.1 hypothetical protein CWS72_20890 [Telmatospirillum siberiense]